jgi:hypothetical protein
MSLCNVSEAGLIGCDELFMSRFNEANAGVSNTHEQRLTLLTHMKPWIADGLPIGWRIVRVNRRCRNYTQSCESCNNSGAYTQSVVETLSECPLNHSLRKVSSERTF